jgi:hypothetical protein
MLVILGPGKLSLDTLLVRQLGWADEPRTA